MKNGENAVDWYDSIDPFIMQLFIIPLFVIGIGVLVSILTKKIWIAPIVTLLLTASQEIWYFWYYYKQFGLTSWNIIFPMISLSIAFIIIKLKEKPSTNEFDKADK